MTKREIVKKISAAISKYGTVCIINAAIRKNVKVERLDAKVAVFVSAFMLAGLIGDAVAKYSDETIDEFFEMIDEIKAEAR